MRKAEAAGIKMQIAKNVAKIDGFISRTKRHGIDIETNEKCYTYPSLCITSILDFVKDVVKVMRLNEGDRVRVTIERITEEEKQE